jgi:hypothetical protein
VAVALTPTERSIRGTLASYTSWANTKNRTTRSQPGRDKFRRSFDEQIEREHPELDPETRAKMAEAAFRAHMARLSLASAKARRKKAENAKDAERVDAAPEGGIYEGLPDNQHADQKRVGREIR